MQRALKKKVAKAHAAADKRKEKSGKSIVALEQGSKKRLFPGLGAAMGYGGSALARHVFEQAAKRALDKASAKIEAKAPRPRQAKDDFRPVEKKAPAPVPFRDERDGSGSAWHAGLPVRPATLEDHKGAGVSVGVSEGPGRGASGSVAGVAIGNCNYKGAPTLRHHTVNTEGGKVRNAITVRNREPVVALPGTSGYNCKTYAMNPTNTALFAWLAGISSRYDMYKFIKCRLMVRTEAPTNARGRIGIMFDYEASDGGPPDRVSFESQMGERGCAVWENQACALRLPPASRTAFWFVADSTDSNGDDRVTTQALINLMTVDFDVTDKTSFEVWVEYEVVLLEATLSNAGSIGCDMFTTGDITATGPAVGTAMASALAWPIQGPAFVNPGSVSLVRGSSGRSAVLYHTSSSASDARFRVYLPALATYAVGNNGALGFNTSVAGSYLIVACAVVASGTVLAAGMGIGTSLSFHQTVWNSKTTQTAQVAPTSAAGINGLLVARVDCVSGVQFTPGTADTAGPFYDMRFASSGTNYTLMYVYVFPMSTGSSQAGPALQITADAAGGVQRTRVDVIQAFDGATVLSSSMRSVAQEARPPVSRLIADAVAAADAKNSAPASASIPMNAVPPPEEKKVVLAFDMYTPEDNANELKRLAVDERVRLASATLTPLSESDTAAEVARCVAAGRKVWLVLRTGRAPRYRSFVKLRVESVLACPDKESKFVFTCTVESFFPEDDFVLTRNRVAGNGQDLDLANPATQARLAELAKHM